MQRIKCINFRTPQKNAEKFFGRTTWPRTYECDFGTSRWIVRRPQYEQCNFCWSLAIYQWRHKMETPHTTMPHAQKCCCSLVFRLVGHSTRRYHVGYISTATACVASEQLYLNVSLYLTALYIWIEYQICVQRALFSDAAVKDDIFINCLNSKLNYPSF